MLDGDRIDLIIFGATGYTGKWVIKEIITLAHNKYTWAIAGRNAEKLQEVLQWATAKTGVDVINIPIIISDCQDEASLNNMARRGCVIINCCGPYRLYGEPVVKACIENGTHHVDVTGEMDFMESVQLKYHEESEKNGVYIISACGVDSVPSDLGVIHFIKNFPGQVNSIESYARFSSKLNLKAPVLNIGTWKSAVYSAGNLNELNTIRQKLYSSWSVRDLKPRLKSKSPVHRCNLFSNRYSLPFFGPDQPVVYRTQMFLHNYFKQRPIQYKAYFVCPSLFAVFQIIIIGLMLTILSKFDCGRRLLLKYPEFFTFGIISDEAPIEEVVVNYSACYRFRGEGWTREIADRYENKEEIKEPPNKQMSTEVFINNPCYGFTALSVVLSALIILTESDKMPSSGGVYTPGGAFINTSFLEKLSENGVSLKVLNQN